MKNFMRSFAAGLKFSMAIALLVSCAVLLAISVLGIIGVVSNEVPWHEPAMFAIAAMFMGSATYAIIDNF